MKIGKVVIAVFVLWFISAPALAANRTATGFYWPTGTSDYNRSYSGFLANQCTPHYEGYMHYSPNDGLYHIGQDIAGNVGDSIYSIGGGEVVSKSTNGWGSGNVALLVKGRLNDGQEYIELHGHITTILSVGDKVYAGQEIGKIGYLPEYTHDHFGIYPYGTIPSGRWGNMFCSEWSATNGFVDPIEWITARTPAFVGSTATWHPAGTLVRAQGDTRVYYLEKEIFTGKMLKRHIASADVFNASGLDWNMIISVSAKELACYRNGTEISGPFLTNGWEGYPEGSLIQQGGHPEVYVVSEGKPRWLNLNENLSENSSLANYLHFMTAV